MQGLKNKNTETSAPYLIHKHCHSDIQDILGEF